MKKATLLGIACLAVVMAPAFASAQATFFLDVRDNVGGFDTGVIGAPYTNGGLNAGGRGDGQILYLMPQVSNGAETFFPGTNWSMGSLTLYADYTAAAGEVLSSVGLDASIAAATTSPGLASSDITVFNANADVGSASSDGNAWDGTSPAALTPTAVAADGTAVSWMKAVRVPVSGAPAMFDSTLGLTTGAGYRLARLDVQAGVRCPVPGGPPVAGAEDLGVSLEVGSLLITQVSSPGPSAAVALNFGYLGGAPEAATGTGDIAGATSTNDDGTIRIGLKSDFSGDMIVNPGDFPGLLGAFGGPLNTPFQRFHGDWNNDTLVNPGDFPGVLAMLSGQGC